MNEETLSNSNLDSDEIEKIEKLTLRWVFQAVLDFGMEAHEVFLKSPDNVKDIAEDITRELLDRLPGFNVQQRIYGNVDYKRARYIILPEKTVRQALFIDSKAEKENRSATIRMSQTSMWVRQRRSSRAVNEKGLLPEISEYGDNHYLTTTCLMHFLYEDEADIHHLKEVKITAIPNGRLQDRYNPIYHGDSRTFLKRIRPESIALSVWSPPYFVGKAYEKNLSFSDWEGLLREVIKLHFPIIKPGGFLTINIADILCFKDASMPRIMAENVSRRKIGVTKEQILEAKKKHPTWNRYQLAAHFECSEQTIDRRLNGNNIRGGKYQTQTRVFLVGDLIETAANEAGFHLYDRRVWVKDAAWENSRWHTISYRSVDEFEYIYIFWKPGTTKVDRFRLTKQEWVNWGSRAVWEIPSVRSNADHDSKFPVELPRRVIKLFSEANDVVLDCFMGSGTTAIAAITEGRKYIGIDKEKKSVQIALEAISSFKADRKGPEQVELFIREIEAKHEKNND